MSFVFRVFHGEGKNHAISTSVEHAESAANLLFDLHKSEINGQVLWVLSN